MAERRLGCVLVYNQLRKMFSSMTMVRASHRRSEAMRVRFPSGAQKHFPEFAIRLEYSKQFTYECNCLYAP